MKKQKSTLWTKDYTCITLATILSAIGGEAMSLPVMLLVFDETGSTMLSSIILICSMLPDIILPVLAAPFIDKGSKKKWIVGLDIATAFLYMGMGIWIRNHTFHYVLYVIFILAIGTISVFYRLAYNAWFPDLIPKGFEQKGYAFSETIYPCVVIVMAPVATFLYEKTTMSFIFALVGGIALLSVAVESRITEQKKALNKEQVFYSLSQYKADIVDGFAYLKKEKGIRNIYTYMSISQGVSTGNGVMIQAFFQSHPVMSVRVVTVILGMIGLAAIWFLIVLPDEENRKVYEAVRE